MSELPKNPSTVERAKDGASPTSGRGADVPRAAGASGQNLDALADTGPETDLWTGRTHWMHFAGRLVVWVILNGGAIVGLLMMSGTGATVSSSAALWIGLTIVGISTILLGARPVLTIVGTRYRLTTQRLFIERGIISKTIDQTELMRVDDVRLYKSLVDRIFRLGSVSIVSTDATDREIVVPGIAESDAVAEGIRQRMRKMRHRTLFVENL